MRPTISLARSLENWRTARLLRHASPSLASMRLPHLLAEPTACDSRRRCRSFDDALYGANGRKTAAEIGRARRAAAIAEQGLERLHELARPGMRECDLAVELNCYMKSLGADDNFLMLCASPHNPAVMPSSNRKIEQGDVLITELTPSYEGQFVQICRTVASVRRAAELQEKYDLVVRAMWAGIETIRPGIPMSQVCAAIDQRIAGGRLCRILPATAHATARTWARLRLSGARRRRRKQRHHSRRGHDLRCPSEPIFSGDWLSDVRGTRPCHRYGSQRRSARRQRRSPSLQGRT